MGVSLGDPGYLLILVASCTLFMACSAGMLVVNKLVLRRFVGLPITLVMVQMAFTALCMVVAPCGLRFGSMRDVLRWSLTIPFLFTLMLASSMLALNHGAHAHHLRLSRELKMPLARPYSLTHTTRARAGAHGGPLCSKLSGLRAL